MDQRVIEEHRYGCERGERGWMATAKMVKWECSLLLSSSCTTAEQRAQIPMRKVMSPYSSPLALKNMAFFAFKCAQQVKQGPSFSFSAPSVGIASSAHYTLHFISLIFDWWYLINLVFNTNKLWVNLTNGVHRNIPMSTVQLKRMGRFPQSMVEVNAIFLPKSLTTIVFHILSFPKFKTLIFVLAQPNRGNNL